MRLAALIQFHRDPLLVRNRARIVRALDPDVAVYGSYGGPERVYDALGGSLRAVLRPRLQDVFCLRGRSTFWKRFHTDLAVSDWYRGVGHRFDFDAVAVMQWDLLPLAPVSELYSHVPADTVAVTGLTPLESVRSRWPWLRYDGWLRELESLQAHLEREHGFRGEPSASLGPGTLLPRAFLEAYSALEVPELCHDEVRLPLYARALGFDVVDNRFTTGWFDSEEERIFNADKRPIAQDVVRAELALPGGRRVFHPYVKPFAIGEATGLPSRISDAVEWAGSAASRIAAQARVAHRARRLGTRNESLPWPG